MSETGYLLNKLASYTPRLDVEVEEILNDFTCPINFHESIDEYIPTPIRSLPVLAKKLGVGSIYVKDDGLRFGINALKILGASFVIERISALKHGTSGICTASDGNHGRAVAWVARKKNIKAVVFLPYHTSLSRINFIKEEGAEVIVSSGNYDQAVLEAYEYAKDNNFTLVQDTSWDNYQEIPATITAGYYTQMHEVSKDTHDLSDPDIDVIIIQAGVGSWPSAVVHFLRKYKQNNKVKIICVEPFESDAIYESIKQSKLATTTKSQKTIMAGLNCGTPSKVALEILKNGTNAFLLISDSYALDAIKYLNAPLPGDTYIAAGESGAAGLGGLIAMMTDPHLKKLKDYIGLAKNSKVLIFNTETVTDPVLFEKISNNEMP